MGVYCITPPPAFSVFFSLFEVGVVGSGGGAGYRGVLLIWILVEQGPTVLAVRTCRSCLNSFSLF